MKWKLTARFLLSVLSIVFIVIIINSIIFIGFFMLQQLHNYEVSSYSEEQFVRDFQQYIDSDATTINQEGLQELHQRNAWIQLLDKNGQVLEDYFAPDDALTHYAPIDIIQVYKYKEFDAETTVYVGTKDELSYLIGIKGSGISRLIMHISGSSTLQFISKFGLLIIIVDLLIAH